MGSSEAFGGSALRADAVVRRDGPACVGGVVEISPQQDQQSDGPYPWARVLLGCSGPPARVNHDVGHQF